MPIDTVTEARDEMLAHFTTLFNAGTGSTVVPIFYDDRPRDLPDNGPWVRVTVKHNINQHTTIGGRLSGGQRFRRFGILTVQIFTPSADGSELADLLGNLALDIFEGQATSTDRIEFRNAVLNEIGHSGLIQNIKHSFQLQI